MKTEIISIETLRIWQEIEKENKKLQSKINKAIKYIKKIINENKEWTMCDEENLLRILGDYDD